MKLSRPLVVRLALLAVLVAVGLYLALRTLPRVQRYRATEAVCAAAERGDWRAALERSEDLVADDTAGRRAAQCRCRALLELGRDDECIGLLESLLAASADEGGEDAWLPDPVLTALVVASRDRAGDPMGAADLAHRGAMEYPNDLLVARQELSLRLQVEDEAAVFSELTRRLERREDDDPTAATLRLDLALEQVNRGNHHDARALIGDDPDGFPEALRSHWFVVHTEVLAGRGQAEELAAAIEEWKRLGADPLELDARHAVLRSINQIEDSEGTTLRMLAAVEARSDELAGSPVLPAVYRRLLGTLVVEGRHEEALALYDELEARLGEVDFMEREDILRSATQSILGEEGLQRVRGTIRFRIEGARSGDRLLVSPGAGDPVDTAYEAHAVPASGTVEVDRAIGSWPQRWVLRDRAGRVHGSGASWPRPGEPVEVPIARRPPEAATGLPAELEPAAGPVAEAGPGDGHRRLFLVILDCADWRIVRYGLARGELPFFERALRTGRRGVLDSYPPFTSLAISKLVLPAKRGLRSFPEMAYQLGGEIEGLNFVGRNPLAALEWVLPEETRLFERFARAGLGTVNLLHSHGSLQVGRNAQVLGPGNAVRQLETYRSSRVLTAAESALLTDPAPEQLAHLSEMAADFDVVRDLVDEPGVDFVALRVASLDLFTHRDFPGMLRSGQDDGDLALYRVYRYLDARLDGLARELDADDTLIVMSDHGIRTPMEHDRRAMFVALGAGVEPGRFDGEPPLQHVSGWLAELLGVEVDWPGTGTQDWIEPPAATPAPPRTAGAGTAAATPE